MHMAIEKILGEYHGVVAVDHGVQPSLGEAGAAFSTAPCKRVNRKDVGGTHIATFKRFT